MSILVSEYAWWLRESESGLYDTDWGNTTYPGNGGWYYTPNIVGDKGDWEAQPMLFGPTSKTTVR
jgi:hypothetical protein